MLLFKRRATDPRGVPQEIVSSNLKVTNERLEKLSGGFIDITKSLKFTQKYLSDETKVTKKDIDTLQKKVTNRLTELEGRSRRNNFHIHGIVEKNNNSQKKCEEQFQKITKDKLQIEKNIKNDRCHRADKNNNRKTVKEQFFAE